MPNKVIKTRIQHKHDYEANWIKAVDFVPLKGEIIIYDAETEELFASQYADLTDEQKATIRRSEAITYVRTKIGNGVDIVTDLPFYNKTSDENVDWNQNDENQSNYIKNRTHYTEDNGIIHKLDPKYIPIDGETISVKTIGSILEPGAYTDNTYTTLAYTWDELVARGNEVNFDDIYPEEHQPCFLVDNEGYINCIFATDYCVVVPEGINGINTEVGVKEIVLPASTTKMFSGEGVLDKIYIKAVTPPPLEYEDYFCDFNYNTDRYGIVNIVVPYGYGELYRTSTNWSQYASYIEEGDMPGEEKQFLVANIPDTDDTTITVNTSNKLSVKDSYKDDVDTYLSRLSETEQPEFMSKTLIAAKNYTDKQLSEFDFIKIVDSLPAEGLENRIYLVPISVEGGFPTGQAGFYRHGTNFTELLCTWDEYIANGVTIDGQFYDGGIYNSNGSSADSGYLMFGVPADVIVQEGYKYDLMSIDCGNIVIPADAKSVAVMSYNYMHPDSNVGLTTLYIKDTTPDYFSLYESEVSPITKIVVPKGCGDTYKMATKWCDYADIIVEAEDNIDTGDQNLFNEWVWVNKNEGTDKEAEYVWEYVSTKTLDIDLTAYVKRTEMTAYVEEKLLTGTW